jgi:molybdopterin-guanine dinucleotide biosynthesis protein A
MMAEERITSVVLAGGEGSRLGGDKLSQLIGEQTLLDRVLSSVALLSDEVLVVLGQGQSPPILNCAAARTVFDIYPGLGALGGIHAGLRASSCSRSLVVAGDMPFLSIPLLRRMVELAPGFDVVVPRVDGKVHPLHAVYDKSCLTVIEDQIGDSDLRVVALMQRLNVRYVVEDDVDKFDPQRLSLFNVNTWADLERARELVTREHGIQ